MQIFLLIVTTGLRGPYGNGLVGHCTSGHSLSPPLRSGRTVRLQLAVMTTTYVNTEIVIAGPPVHVVVTLINIQPRLQYIGLQSIKRRFRVDRWDALCTCR